MLILGLLLPLLLGLAICWLVIPNLTILVRLALSYGLGFGFLTLAMFCLDVFGAKFSLVNTTIFVLGIISLLLLLKGKRNWASLLLMMKANPFPRMRTIIASLSAFEKIIVGLLIFLLLSHLVIAVYWPVFWSDSLTLYDLRAKLLFEEQSFSGAGDRLVEQLVNLDRRPYVFRIAPMTSLVHTWLYLCGWASPKVFYPLLFISMAILFYHFLREYVPRYHALLFTLVLVTTPYMYLYAITSYLHFPFAFYFSVGTFYLYRWIRMNERSSLLLAGVLLGLSAWVRQLSGIFFLGYLIILLFICISHRRFLAFFLFCGLYFSIASLWNIYFPKVFHFTAVGGDSRSISQVFEFLPMMGRFFDFFQWKKALDFFWRYVSPNFRVIYYLLILTTLLYINRVWKHRFLFLIVFSNLILFLIGIYVEILNRGYQAPADSAKRIFITFIPIIWYFVALITAEGKSSNSNAGTVRVRLKEKG